MKNPLILAATHLLLLSLLGLGACVESMPPGEVTNGQAGGEDPAVPEPDMEPEPGAGNGSQEEISGDQVARDRTVIPGQRVGPVTSETSREDLVDLYGEDKLQDQAVPMGEGTTEPGTLVDLGPDQQFSIVWRDQAQTAPLLAKDFGPAWQTPEGLGVGVPYSTVQSVLGTFKLYGFAWDYEGSLVLEGSNLDQYYGDLLLRVRPSQASAAAYPQAYQALMGDALFAGDDPNLEPLDIQVYEMTVYLNAPKQ